MNAVQILRILKYGSPEERKNFVRNSPENTFKDDVLSLVGSKNPTVVILGMVSLIQEYCCGRNPEVGAPLALATHNYAKEIFESGSDHDLRVTTLGNLAYYHVNALELLGKTEEVKEFTKKYITEYERMGKEEKEVREFLPSLKLARIRALINLDKIDEAYKMLQDPNLKGNFATDIEIKRLKAKLDRLIRPITEIDAGQGKSQEVSSLSGTELIDIMKEAISLSVEDEIQRDKLLNATDKLDPSHRLDLNKEKDYQQLLKASKSITEFLTEGKVLNIKEFLPKEGD